MKKIFKYLSALICTSFCFICILSSFISKDTNVQTPTRDVELSIEKVNYDNYFNSFRNHKLEHCGGITKFSGEKQLEDFDLSFLNYVADDNLKNDLKEYVDFEFIYNKDISKMIITATINNGKDDLIENLNGYVFKNNVGETDAIITLDDGSTLLLSDLSDKYINDCGWFSKLIKGVVSTTVAVIIVAVLPVSIPAVVAVSTTAAMTYGAISYAEKVKAETNYIHNINLIEPTSYINGQNYYNNWKFGISTLDYNGCGVIAAYNVLRGLNKSKKLSDVIYEFDYNSGTIVSGLFGADPSHYLTYFSKNNIEIKRFSSYSNLQNGINNMSMNQMILVCAWCGDSIFDGAHYVAASYNPYTKLISIYNRYSNSNSISTCHSFDKSIIGGDIITAFIIG